MITIIIYEGSARIAVVNVPAVPRKGEFVILEHTTFLVECVHHELDNGNIYVYVRRL